MKARIVIEVEVSQETAQRINEADASLDYIEGEIALAAESFDSFEIVELEEIKDWTAKLKQLEGAEYWK